MTPKPISAADDVAMRVVIVTLDNHLAGAVERARTTLAAEIPGLEIAFHAASDWGDDAEALARCKDDIAQGDIILATMLFMEDHVRAVAPALAARRESCDAMIGAMSAGEIVKLTRLGPLRMDDKQSGPMALLKKLRGGKTGGAQSNASSGERQMAVLRRLPKILKYVPGAAQDLRAYFLSLQYWLAGSEENVIDLVRFLVGRYADGERRHLRGAIECAPPREYPDIGLYHPAAPTRITSSPDDLPAPHDAKGAVGVLIMRSYALAGDVGHYDGVIAALEAQGLQVIPAFASGLDARPAIEKYFLRDGAPIVDAVVSLTGFSLVGGPAYSDSDAAKDVLARLDVPYLAAHPLEFQSIESWRRDDRGLSPIEQTIMVAIPELDGATNPIVFGGRCEGGSVCGGCARRCEFETSDPRGMRVCAERAEMLAARAARLVRLRKTAAHERKVAIVLFNFPPNGGAVGTAAHLDVFSSLHNTLQSLRSQGYDVDPPASAEALRESVLNGNALRYGADANVVDRINADDHVRRERWLSEIEAQWGPAPGRIQTNGSDIFVLGARFGNVLVSVQPAFGYEGDPMRLLFERGFAPTHAFSAFYRYLREDFAADAILHFGTHGALEFMPGKQSGLDDQSWPDRLIGEVPNFYLYAANNPSEGIIAKRRGAATLISHLTPALANSGLYKGLAELKASIESRRALGPADTARRSRLDDVIKSQAAALDLAAEEPQWADSADIEIERIRAKIAEIENTLVPDGMHVVGETRSAASRAELLHQIGEAAGLGADGRTAVEAISCGASARAAARLAPRMPRDVLDMLERANSALSSNAEISALMRALDGRYIAPAPGGDLLRAPDILPTGRNIHGFDPFRLPSVVALSEGARQADLLLARHIADGHDLPQTIAIVLWGSDTLKSEGAPIAQALWLMGARPRFDGYGRLCGGELIDLETLGRPRIDVVCTLSGIFRDLLPMQTKLLAEAALLAARADEPREMNFVRAHVLARCEETGCDIETAALRVFSNADGAYGSNVNMLLESGAWNEEDELADAYEQRKSFAYGVSGRPAKRGDLLQSLLSHVDLAHQNLESVELGVTTIDHYFDTLGGIGRAVRRARGEAAPVYISDQTQGVEKVRTLSEQVALETRSRMLNPRWYEGMLRHGYEGVRQIETHVTNTMGWSATTGEVAPWVYQGLAETFVLDTELRERLAALNAKSSARLANRLIEAHERHYWTPDPATLEALREAGRDLEDRVEGVALPASA